MQTSIAIDKATKNRAAKRAKAEHLPLAVIVRIFLNDYADGKLSIGTHAVSAVNAESIHVDAALQKKMDAVITKWHDKIKA